MPTYDYKCTECGKEFEVFQKITEESLDKCKFCSGKVKRIISGGAGVIFKGSGFYCTDYKNGPSKAGTGKAEKKETPCSSSGCNECPASKPEKA